MTSDRYTVELKGDGVSITREVSREVGEKIIVLAVTGDVVASDMTTQAQKVTKRGVEPSSDADRTTPSAPELSIREVLDDAGAKRAPDKITVIGNYLDKMRGAKSFSKEDVVSMYQMAAERVPANLARDLKWTLKAGWIAARPGERGKYYVTHTGIQAIEAKFSPEFVKRTRGFASGVSKRRVDEATPA